MRRTTSSPNRFATYAKLHVYKALDDWHAVTSLVTTVAKLFNLLRGVWKESKKEPHIHYKKFLSRHSHSSSRPCHLRCHEFCRPEFYRTSDPDSLHSLNQSTPKLSREAASRYLTGRSHWETLNVHHVSRRQSRQSRKKLRRTTY